MCFFFFINLFVRLETPYRILISCPQKKKTDSLINLNYLNKKKNTFISEFCMLVCSNYAISYLFLHIIVSSSWLRKRMKCRFHTTTTTTTITANICQYLISIYIFSILLRLVASKTPPIPNISIYIYTHIKKTLTNTRYQIKREREIIYLYSFQQQQQQQ